MKKIIALVLTLCMVFTLVFAVNYNANKPVVSQNEGTAVEYGEYTQQIFNLLSSMTAEISGVNRLSVDLTKTVKIAGSKGNITLNAPQENGSSLNVKTQGNNHILLNKDNDTVMTSNVWTGGMAVALKLTDDTFVNLKKTSKYVVNVNYDVTGVDTTDKTLYPQIAIIYNNNTYAGNAMQDNGTVIMKVNKHSKLVESATMSCVISGVEANALRLAFDGHGKFSVNSVTIDEITENAKDVVLVTVNDTVYNRNDIIVAEKGAAIPNLQNTLIHNFGGWYSSDEKITTVNKDVSVTSKWFGKADVNMDDAVNTDDLNCIKDAIKSGKTDSVYDVDRNSVIDNKDVNFIRKSILGIQAVTIADHNVRAYELENSGISFFMTTMATNTLVDTFKDLCGLDLENNSKATKKIVVGVPNVAQNTVKDSALNTLIGVKGDLYGVDDYKIFLYNGNLYIEGGSDYATASAINRFIKFITKYEMIPVDFQLSGTYNGDVVLDGYSYAWGDEFNSAALDRNKWLVETGTAVGPVYSITDRYYLLTRNDRPWSYNSTYKKFQDGEIRYLDDEGNNFYLKDGALVMNTKATDYGYSATKLSTKNKYDFTYGIMTARIKLATKNGAASTFWSRTLDNIGGQGASVNEMDFVENFGAEQVRPNLHTWKNYTDHTDHNSIIDFKETVYPQGNESLSDSYHEITLSWTNEKIVFYFDGVKYLEQDIGSDPATWEAFYKSTYLIMSVSAPSDIYSSYANGTSPGAVLGNLINSFSENYFVDYIRVYQK